MHKLLFPGILAATIALAATPSIEAGERQLKRVAIGEDEHYWWASGNAGDVFNSQGTVETIWCRVRGGENYNDGVCFARDEKGRTLQCHSFEETTIRPMLSINGDSTIQFLVNKKEAWCAMVTITNGSYAAPKRQTTPEDAAPFDTTGILDEVQQ
jgi:hypothetical protein